MQRAKHIGNHALISFLRKRIPPCSCLERKEVRSSMKLGFCCKHPGGKVERSRLYYVQCHQNTAPVSVVLITARTQHFTHNKFHSMKQSCPKTMQRVEFVYAITTSTTAVFVVIIFEA